MSQQQRASARTVFASLDEVRAAVGCDLGTSDWVAVTPAQRDLFRQATGATGGDAGAYLALSLTNRFLPEIVEVRGAPLGVNYGTGRVRFPAPAPPGRRLRGSARLVACDDIPGGVQTTMRVTVEIEGEEEPACVVDALSRWLAPSG